MKDFEIKTSPLTNEIYLVSGLGKVLITEDVVSAVCQHIIDRKNSYPFTYAGKLFLLKTEEQNLKPNIKA